MEVITYLVFFSVVLGWNFVLIMLFKQNVKKYTLTYIYTNKEVLQVGLKVENGSKKKELCRIII